MSEIEFFTLYGFENALVVYAGAAPGVHITYLSKLFPTYRFVLVDPIRSALHNTTNIDCRQCLFTDETAQEFANRNDVLFISDIRSSMPDQASWELVESIVSNDMAAQKKWHKIIKPKRSMLKFRLPWDPGVTKYLPGDVYLPIWGPQTTTEARLIVAPGPDILYDNTEHEWKMFYFNTVTRIGWYPHNIVAEGLDHCYDCACEVLILQQYLQSIKQNNNINNTIAKMSHEISLTLNTNRTPLTSPLTFADDG